MNFVSYLIAVAAGAANPAQAGANAQLNKSLESPIWATLFVYATGLVGVLLIQVVVRQAWPDGQWNQVPWWAWIGGVLSIASTIAGLTLAHKMGSGVFTGLSLTASVVTSIALDQFALFGFKQHSASPLRLTGAGLLIAGLWLVAKF